MIKISEGKALLLVHEDKPTVDIFAPTLGEGLEYLRQGITEGVVKEFTTLTYRESDEATVVNMYRGPHLVELLANPPPGKLKSSILQAIDGERIEAAGVLVFCLRTRRFLLQRRSSKVPAGGKYAMFGGRIDNGETPVQAAVREAMEEGKMQMNAEDLTALTVFDDGRLRYHNFIILVFGEFEPSLNKDECESFVWTTYADLEKLDLLPELRMLFNTDPKLQMIANVPDDPDFDWEKFATQLTA